MRATDAVGHGVDDCTELRAIAVGDVFEHVGPIALKESIVGSLKDNGCIRCRKVARVGDNARIVHNLQEGQYQRGRLPRCHEAKLQSRKLKQISHRSHRKPPEETEIGRDKHGQ